MYSLSESLGFYDVGRLLRETGGELTSIARDLGRTWTITRRYDWKIFDDEIRVQPRGDSSRTISIKGKLPLTGQFLAFVGLYDGDGNKARDGNRPIGFSQRELHVHKFAYEMLNSLFGNQFSTQWAILEDTRRFELDFLRKPIEEIRNEAAFEKASSAELQREFLRREFLNGCKAVGLGVNRSSVRNPVVSSKKGARKSGGSSLEYIQTLTGSDKFMGLWLKIVRDITDYVLLGTRVDWIEITRDPLFILDVSSYLSGLSWRSGRGARQYVVSKSSEDKIDVRKSSRKAVKLNASLPLTPLIFLMSGIYLAEGDTKKDYLFVFESQQVPITVALTSSEAEYVEGFTRFAEALGNDLVQSWKVKVGFKYWWETEQLAQARGSILLSSGSKGQGYVRTLEVSDALQTWALRYVPDLAKYADKYHHAEVTGVGIPRVHVMVNGAIDYYVIALVKDIIFNNARVEPHLKSILQA
jgi:hypothetical protein